MKFNGDDDEDGNRDEDGDEDGGGDGGSCPPRNPPATRMDTTAPFRTLSSANPKSSAMAASGALITAL